jgi:hypothetical protein
LKCAQIVNDAALMCQQMHPARSFVRSNARFAQSALTRSMIFAPIAVASWLTGQRAREPS